MPVILLKRDGLHDIDVARRDWSSSRLSRESDGSAKVLALSLIGELILMSFFRLL